MNATAAPMMGHNNPPAILKPKGPLATCDEGESFAAFCAAVSAVRGSASRYWTVDNWLARARRHKEVTPAMYRVLSEVAEVCKMEWGYSILSNAVIGFRVAMDRGDVCRLVNKAALLGFVSLYAPPRHIAGNKRIFVTVAASDDDIAGSSIRKLRLDERSHFEGTDYTDQPDDDGITKYVAAEIRDGDIPSQHDIHDGEIPSRVDNRDGVSPTRDGVSPAPKSSLEKEDDVLGGNTQAHAHAILSDQDLERFNRLYNIWLGGGGERNSLQQNFQARAVTDPQALGYVKGLDHDVKIIRRAFDQAVATCENEGLSPSDRTKQKTVRALSGYLQKVFTTCLANEITAARTVASAANGSADRVAYQPRAATRGDTARDRDAKAVHDYFALNMGTGDTAGTENSTIIETEYQSH